MGHIYSLLNKINGKRYIGQTARNIRRRLSQHYCYVKTGSTQAIHHAIRKYGPEAFYLQTWEVPDEQLDKAEIAIIKQFDTQTPNGYNLTSGGSGTPNHKGQVAWNKGIKATEVQKKKMSEAKKGHIPWNKGLKGAQVSWRKDKKFGPQSEETKQKRAESMKICWANRTEEEKKLLGKKISKGKTK
jgi:group I intron endonuclease